MNALYIFAIGTLFSFGVHQVCCSLDRIARAIEAANDREAGEVR
jgi:hypothetical protein